MDEDLFPVSEADIAIALDHEVSVNGLRNARCVDAAVFVFRSSRFLDVEIHRLRF